MTAPPPAHAGDTADLAEQAGLRAARMRLLGRLLVAEPGPEEVALAGALPSLARHLTEAGGLRADYHRVLIAGVACFESVFTSPDGQLGAVDPALLAIYRRFDVDWEAHRVAAADHLGVQLLAYAQLCELEAEAWADDRPDRASQVVETERELLARHLGSWAPAASEAIARAGAATAYVEVAALLDEALAAEADTLRPSPQHSGMPPVGAPVDDRPQGGAGRIARRLLAPARAGGYLLADDVAPLAAALETPWRPSDTRSRLRHVVDTALAQARAGTVVEVLAPVVEGWRARWAAARDASPGAWRTFEAWRLRADATLDWLGDLDAGAPAAAPATLVVGSARRAAQALATLSSGGIAVTTDAAPEETLGGVDVVVRVEVGGPERWEGEAPAGARERLDGGP